MVFGLTSNLLYIFDIYFVLVISIWLKIKPNNLRKFYSQISEKHDQTIWGIKLFFFAFIEATKNIILFRVMPQKLLANQFAWFFSFDLFDLLILIIGVHCYIVFVSFAIPTIKECLHLRHLQLGPTKCVSQKCSKLIGITWLV